MHKYFLHSRTPYYGVVASLPLLVVYELLLTLNTDLNGQIRNAADVWVRVGLRSLGLSPLHVTLFMILALLLAIPMLRARSEPIQGRFLGYIVVEALIYGFLLGILINTILEFLFSLFRPAVPAQWMLLPSLAMPNQMGLTQGLALSLGAGLFEEFFFRVILVNALLYLTRFFLVEWLSILLSIVGAALLFSLAHYVGPLGEPLEMHGFMFRWLAGLLFTILYYGRGFAVTAYSHAFYDILVISGLFRIVGP